MRNFEEISSYRHQHKKKWEKKHPTVATNLSYCQCEHISTQVADKHAVTAIKKRLNICTTSSLKKINSPLLHSLECPYTVYTLYNIPLQSEPIWPQVTEIWCPNLQAVHTVYSQPLLDPTSEAISD